MAGVTAIDTAPLLESSEEPTTSQPEADESHRGAVESQEKPSSERKEAESEEGAKQEDATQTVAEADAAAVPPEAEKSVARRPQTSFAAQTSMLGKSKDLLVTLGTLSRADAWAKMNSKLANFQSLQVIADAMGVSPAFVATATVSGLLGFLLFGLGGQLVCTVVGALFPAFESYKAVESNDFVAMRFWMTYWVVYAIMSSVECISYYIIVNLPFYYPLKLVALLWLTSRSTGGAKYFYMLCIAPAFNAYRERIDDALDQSRATVKHSFKRAATTALDAGMATGTVGLSTLKRGLVAGGCGVGTLTQIAFEAAKARRPSGVALHRAKTAPSLVELPDDKQDAEEKVEQAQVASPEDESPAGSPPCFRGQEAGKDLPETVATAVAAGGD